jgi:hypothetical protein
MKNSIDTIGNQTRDLPAYRTVPQPTALPRQTKQVRKKYIKETIQKTQYKQYKTQ